MQIKGFQKLTLLDYPNKVACLIFTGGCNFRCPYCHNASLAKNLDTYPDISEEEIFSFLEQRKNLLDGVSITGGEPLMQPDIEDFVLKIKKMGYAVKIDTNGSYPDKLASLIDKGLVDYIAMDIKNTKDKYLKTVGGKGLNLENIEKSIAILKASSIEYEFRTTVVNELHTPEDIFEIANIVKGAPQYFIQNFVQSDDILSEGVSPVEKKELAKMLKNCLKQGLNAKIR